MAGAAIFILTQNTESRRIYLKTCLYFLFKNFNAQHRYPVLIFHEGDYDAKAQREILMGIRSSCRSLVMFVTLDAEDFALPHHIDAEKMARCIATKPVPYWRNDKYRMMCRWWLVHMPKYAKGYDYIMRLDDDSIIEEPVTQDLFKWAADRKLVYASNIIHIDCGICCYGLKEFLDREYPDRGDFIRQMFVPSEIQTRAVRFHPFRSLLSIMHEGGAMPEIPERMQLWMPLCNYNNYHITRTDFWLREDVQALIKKIDEDGSIFYYRWGDAPLQSVIVMLHAKPDEISRTIFKYSKRMQREAFYGDDKEYHCYMPETYDKSSCITETQKND
jgi:hypothetical protein